MKRYFDRLANPNTTTIATFGLLLLVAVVAHGLLLLVDGFGNEDYAVYDTVISRDWDTFRAILEGRGSIQQFYTHAVMSYAPAPFFAYKLVNFLSIVAVGFLTYKIAVKTRLVAELDAVFIALFVMIYPAFQFTWLIIARHQFDLAWFLAGILLALNSKSSPSSYRVFYRVASLAAFAYSLTINSFIVFYASFFLLLFLVEWNELRYGVRDILIKWLPRNLDFALLPFVYYIGSQIFFPRLEGYNSITIDYLLTGWMWRQFLENAVASQFVNAVGYVGNSLLVSAITLAILTAGLIAFYQLTRRQQFRDAKARGSGLVAFGLLMFPLAMAPYIVVGKVPAATGSETRHALLMAFPVALILVGLIRLLFLNRSKTYIAGLMLHFVLIVIFSVSSLYIYFEAQARSAWEQSFLRNIQNTEGAEDASIYWLINNYPDYWPDDEVPPSLRVNYHSWFLSRMLETIWPEKLIDSGLLAAWAIGDEPFITTEMSILGPHVPYLYFGESPELAGWDGYSRCQVVISVEATDKFESDLDLSLQHLYYRFLARSELDSFLSEVSQVYVQPIGAPEAALCQREIDGPLVFNPRTDSSVAYAAFLLTVLPEFHHEARPEPLDPTRLALENTVYETTVSSDQASTLLPAIGQWRESYLPGHLLDNGIEYLFIDMEWASWLDDEQYRVILESPENYELVHEWNDPVWTPSSRLYRVVGEAK